MTGHRDAPFSACTGFSRDIRQAGYTPDSRPKQRRDRQAVEEHAEVDVEVRVLDQAARVQRAQHEERQHEPDRAADQRQDDVFDDELADERARRRRRTPCARRSPTRAP